MRKLTSLREKWPLFTLVAFTVYFNVDLVAWVMLAELARLQGQHYNLAIPLTNFPFWAWYGFPITVDGLTVAALIILLTCSAGGYVWFVTRNDIYELEDDDPRPVF